MEELIDYNLNMSLHYDIAGTRVQVIRDFIHSFQKLILELILLWKTVCLKSSFLPLNLKGENLLLPILYFSLCVSLGITFLLSSHSTLIPSITSKTESWLRNPYLKQPCYNRPWPWFRTETKVWSSVACRSFSLLFQGAARLLM